MDFSFFFDAFQSIGDLLVNIRYFFNVTIFEFATNTFIQGTTWVVVQKLDWQIYILEISYNAAIGVLDQLDIRGLINSSFSLLDSQLLSFLTRYRVIEGLNLLSASAMTRFIWGFFK